MIGGGVYRRGPGTVIPPAVATDAETVAAVAAEAAARTAADSAEATARGNADTAEAAARQAADALLTPLTVERETSRRPAVLARFAPEATDVAVQRVSSTLYYMFQHLGARRYWRQALRRTDTNLSGAPPGGAATASPHALHYADICAPMLSVDDDDASVARTGAGWGQISQALAYGGDYYRTTTSGDYATWTTPANTSKAALRVVQTTNAGVGLVEIDSDKTRANLLPTAQQLVDAGTLASSVLVANGGTLNPTDRVLNEYRSVADNDALIALADDLTPGVHTVKITCTGYKQSASTDIRLYLGGVAYATPTTTLTTANTTMFPLRMILGQTSPTFYNESAWEYAFAIVPTGGSNSTLIGGVHGYEFQDTVTFTMDGTLLALTDGQTATGKELVVARATRLRHPDTGTTDIISMATVYTLNADGLRVVWTPTVLVGFTANSSYVAMQPVVHPTAQKARVYSNATVLALTAHDGATKGHAVGRVVALWEASGPAAAALYVPDPSTSMNDWLNAYAATTTPGLLSVQDNSANGFSKAYATRVATGATPVVVAAGSAWPGSDSWRKIAWLPAGADAALATA